jgi:predicted RNase H-related nuclease YkuK (DUF458 family)
MLDKSWMKMDGKKVELIPEVKALLALPGEREVHVGSDSQQVGSQTEFVTVIVILEKGKGGRAFYVKSKEPRVRSLRERLMKEVWTSVTVGLELNAMVPETVGLTIHIDANPDVKFRSSDHIKELVGMVVGQGFKTLMKPESWAAAHVADHVVKHKNFTAGR